jgi:hypothetical protein
MKSADSNPRALIGIVRARLLEDTKACAEGRITSAQLSRNIAFAENDWRMLGIPHPARSHICGAALKTARSIARQHAESAGKRP